MQRLFIIFGSAFIVFTLLFFGVRSTIANRGKTAILNIEVVPNGSSITINGKGTRAGKVPVKPGDYNVIVSHFGFITEKRQVGTTAKKTSYVGVSLVPNSSATNDWYRSHPADAKKAEAISSHNFDAASAELANNPLVRRLPYIGAGFEFRVDYGAARNPDKPGQPIIYIQAGSVSARSDSLRWIRSYGYDPAMMDIVFKDAVNPFSGAKP